MQRWTKGLRNLASSHSDSTVKSQYLGRAQDETIITLFDRFRSMTCATTISPNWTMPFSVDRFFHQRRSYSYISQVLSLPQMYSKLFRANVSGILWLYQLCCITPPTTHVVRTPQATTLSIVYHYPFASLHLNFRYCKSAFDSCRLLP